MKLKELQHQTIEKTKDLVAIKRVFSLSQQHSEIQTTILAIAVMELKLQKAGTRSLQVSQARRTIT
jgi:hypothetical protein